MLKDCLHGEVVRKPSIPKNLKRTYGVENLYVEDLPSFWRLLYTVETVVNASWLCWKSSTIDPTTNGFPVSHDAETGGARSMLERNELRLVVTTTKQRHVAAKTHEEDLYNLNQTRLNMTWESKEPPLSPDESQCEMDPETRAVFEKIMKRRRKLFKRLAKM